MKSILAASALVLTAAAFPAQAQIIAESDLSRGELGHFLIEVELNGQGVFTALVDTAASNTVLMDGAIEALGLAPLAQRGIGVQTATGQIMLEYYSVDALEIGGVDLAKGRMLGAFGLEETLVDQGVDLILGVDVLGRYGLEFDQGEGVFRLHARDTDFDELANGWAELPLQRGIAGLVFTELQLNGAPVQALFDTGASRIVVNPAAGRAAGVDGNDPRALAAERPVSGLGGQPTEALDFTGMEISWGEVTWPATRITQSDASVFSMLRMRGPGMIAGAPLMGEHDFVVDYENLRVLLAPREV